MSDGALTVVPDDCDLGAKQWRGMTSAIAELRSKAVWWATALQLDDLPSTFRSSLSEFEEEMNLSADLLEVIAQHSREADEFDGSYESLGADAGIIATLVGSLNDGVGAAWSYHLDPEPLDEDGEHTVHMGYLPLFGDDGPRPEDVMQGGLGSCGLLSVAAGAALTDPEHLREIMTDNGDGTYTVLVDGELVTVDDEFPASEGNLRYAQSTNVLWPMVLEKAVAARYGYDYGSVDDGGGDPERSMHALGYDVAETQLNPQFADDPSDADVAVTMTLALESGHVVTANDAGAFGLGVAHAWTVVSVAEVDGVVQVTLRNPWGPDRPGMRVGDEGDWIYSRGPAVGNELDFARSDDPGALVVNDSAGTVTMPIDMFTANFDDIDVAIGARG